MNRPPVTTPRPGRPEGGAPLLAAAQQRAARLEALLGDPRDPANPHSSAALAAADTRGAPPEPTEALLGEAGVGAECVPVAAGGLFTRADLLLAALRPVFRRDLALGLGAAPLAAAAPVWAVGDARQRRRTAQLLLNGGRLAVVTGELAHANALTRGGPSAHRARDGWILHGRKDLVRDAHRAGAWVVHARTAPGRSVFLLEPGLLPADAVRTLPGAPASGLRGTPLSALEFTHCPLPADTLLGRPGQGTALALRTFQLDRCLVAGAAVAAAETVLRLAAHTVFAGRDTRTVRRRHTALAPLFADLLACDSMATVALRALSLPAGRTPLTTAALSQVVLDVLRENLEDLIGVLGTHGHTPGSAHAVRDKLARDLPHASLGHTGTAACHAVIVPQLRGLAAHSWFRGAAPPPALFRTGADLPELKHRLPPAADGGDLLSAALLSSAERLAHVPRADGARTVLAALARAFTGELHELRRRCTALPDAFDPAAVVLSDRFALLQGAAAVLGVWEGQDGTDAFLAEPAWAVLALSRLARRLGITAPAPPEDCVTQVLDELARRGRSDRDCALDGGAPTY
ncbi:acyl-CoA dehydrogenase [Streptomyces spiroverticillatus]|uniref:Acyl-CoA dehydrogenase n=1 Tax=Streptomyces finlayi TaxID=67296 RepID=A0A918X510_9ACTN|nr:acyl-CoA dehydrogenase [Streptomyces finlayi]GHA35682.1 acyl-CoA dehydrogenase [Streptomyces spiroverticillatus]GHD12669.1 acyl-CoA dehydrogenase [Streptomyces finlayi]